MIPYPSLHLIQQAVVPECDFFLAFPERPVQPRHGTAHFACHCPVFYIRDVATLQLSGQEEATFFLRNVFFSRPAAGFPWK